MTALQNVKAILGITDSSQDELLNVYLDMAEKEILAWTFGADTGLNSIPSWLMSVQTMAVVEGYNQRGAEGETYQTVDGLTHSFAHPTMIEYIHKNAPSHAKLI